MIHKTIRSLIIFFFLLIQLTGFSSLAVDNDSFWYNPTDCKLEDNAYNVSRYYSLQWWYLDTNFDNNYSAHIGFLTVGARATHGFFLFQINIYKDGQIFSERIRLVPVRFVEVSINEPVIKLSGKEVFRSYLDDQFRLCTAVLLEIKDIKVNLLFTGLTQGWKGYTGRGMWGCPIPKAEVTGIITLNGKQIPVQGIGYQERGWDVQRLHRSWYWGKFQSKNTNVVFSQNMGALGNEDLFFVMVNIGENNYTSIQRKNIEFIHIKYVANHGRLIPVESGFIVHEKSCDIQVRFVVQSIDFKTLVFMNYWRLHVHVTGTISVDGMTEEIDDIQIMEIFHFP
ncbi:MAG: hypothetical protein NT038_07840 [Euryarchaeota archaeon]|nr:hypothetical protein [Euryarchaeota archaeon]